MKKNIKR